MKETIVLGSAGLIIILNGYIGHHYPPSGLMGTPIVLGITSLIIVMGLGRSSSILKSIFLIVCAIFNDYLIRNYSGGIHDSEGFAWISLYFLYGLIASYLILILGTLNSKDKPAKKIISLCLFPLVMLLYMGVR